MNIIREVKERADIVKVAEVYGLKLNRAYKCVCPFHSEKTASLSISPYKQIWKCFGCNKRWRCNFSCIRIIKYKCFRVSKKYK